MNWKSLAVPALALAFLAAFIGGGYLLTRQPQAESEGEAGAAGARGAVSPGAGNRLFWTRGRCSTCHRVGERGGSLRGPELGEGDLGPAIGARAGTRARERALQTGRLFSSADYLVESLVDPGAYVVSGYRNEMPPAHQPPVSLTPDEIRSLVGYMQSLGGRVDMASIRLPESVAAGAKTEATPPAN